MQMQNRNRKITLTNNFQSKFMCHNHQKLRFLSNEIVCFVLLLNIQRIIKLLFLLLIQIRFIISSLCVTTTLAK